jgi:hypothetical protein
MDTVQNWKQVAAISHDLAYEILVGNRGAGRTRRLNQDEPRG